MSLSIVIPLRVTDVYRRRNWTVIFNHTREVAEALGAELVVAEHGRNYADRPGVRRVEVPGRFSRSKARNLGWRAATGAIVCFLDSDMVMPLKSWVGSVEAAADYDCFSPSRRLFNLGRLKTENRIRDGRYTFSPHGLPSIQGNLFGGIAFCRRSFLVDVGGWDERFAGHGYEDIAMEKLAYAGGYSVGFGDYPPIHLYHTSRQSTGKRRARDLYRSEYAGRKFADILTRRGLVAPDRTPKP